MISVLAWLLVIGGGAAVAVAVKNAAPRLGETGKNLLPALTRPRAMPSIWQRFRRWRQRSNTQNVEQGRAASREAIQFLEVPQRWLVKIKGNIVLRAGERYNPADLIDRLYLPRETRSIEIPGRPRALPLYVVWETNPVQAELRFAYASSDVVLTPSKMIEQELAKLFASRPQASVAELNTHIGAAHGVVFSDPFPDESRREVKSWAERELERIVTNFKDLDQILLQIQKLKEEAATRPPEIQRELDDILHHMQNQARKRFL